jgi:SAM-dependent methyltransferase
MYTTATATAYWTAPRSPEHLSAWLTEYYESASKSYRQDLLSAIAPHSPVSSIFEVGCHCGPNLKALQPLGEFVYTGIDVNADAVLEGVKQAVAAGYDTRTRWGIGSILDITFMSNFADRGYDVVLSSSALMYVHPVDLPQALKEMARLSARIVVMQEPVESERHGETYHQWVHEIPCVWKNHVQDFDLVTVSEEITVAVRR